MMAIFARIILAFNCFFCALHSYAITEGNVDDGRNINDVLDIYVDYVVNGYATNFIANTNCWLYGVDISCCSMWTDCSTSAFGPTTTAVTVISPRHVIYASHFDYTDWVSGLPAMPLGKIYYFRGKSGTVYSRALTAKMSVGADIGIGLLDSALPTNDVACVAILPENYEEYIGDGKYLPVLFIDQQERAYVGSCRGLPTDSGEFAIGWLNIANRYPYRKFTGAISGDSSSPKFFIANDQLILLGVTHRAGGAAGAFVTRHINRIETAMRTLLPSPEYGLKKFNLENYPKL